MLNFLTIHLQAIFKENNIFRKYEIYVGKDLFKTWIITTINGRIGTKGKMTSYHFNSLPGLHKKLSQIMKKRQNSHKRIGTNYKIKAFSFNSDSLEEELLELMTLIEVEH